MRIVTSGPGVDPIIALEEARALVELLTRVVENPAQYYNLDIGKPGYARDSVVRVSGRDVGASDTGTYEQRSPEDR